MSTVTESRGVQYSAEAAGTHGALRCHITRCPTDDERGARFTVLVGNDSIDDAHALAFVFFDASDAHRRTLVQTIIGPHAEFSTSVMLNFTPAGVIPEVHFALSNGNTEFTLVVPRAQSDLALPAPRAEEAALADEFAARPAPVLTALVRRPGSPAQLAAHIAAPIPSRPGIRAAPRRLPATTEAIAALPSIGPILVLFAALMGFAVYIVARPQIPELSVPATAAAGSSLAIRYRATGVGKAAYTVLGPDGVAVGRGSLVIGSGVFRVDVPAASAAQTYLVRLQVANLLGAAVAEAYVHVPPSAAALAAAPRPSASAAPPAPPQIRSLAVDRAVVAGGQTLTVYYDVVGTGGSIVLLDPAAQITYGRQSISASGHSTFIAPHVDSTRLLTVVATERRGGDAAESRIGVSVIPGSDDGTPMGAAGLPPALDEAAPSGPGSATSAALTAPAHVRSGEPIWVDLHGTGDGVEIVLLDSSGRELDRREIAPGKHNVEFTAPEVSQPTRLVFEATVPQGVGTITLVRPISVTP